MPPSTRTLLTGLAGTVLLATVVAGCGVLPPSQAGGTSSSRPSAPAAREATASTSPTPPVPPVAFAANVADRSSEVGVDTVVKVTAEAGTMSKVKLSYRGVDARGAATRGTVDGALSKDRTTWAADERLEPSATYTLAVAGANVAEQTTTSHTTFRTSKLTLDEQTFPSLYPLKGSRVGVGMPVVLTFDVPVTDQAEFEKNLHVTSTPKQPGSWNWLSATQVRFRPERYWSRAPGCRCTRT